MIEAILRRLPRTRIRGRAPGHVEDLKRYRACSYRMAGNRIPIVTDRRIEAVEVHPSSVDGADMAGVTVEYHPPWPLPAP